MPQLRNLSLFTKTTLATALILVLFFGVMAFWTYQQKRKDMLEEAVTRARLIASETVQTREYLSKHLRLGQVRLSDERYALIPIVASNRVGQLVAQEGGFRLRQISDRFRNPDNAPDGFEKAVLASFAENPYMRESYALTEEDDVPTLRYLQPFRADESCLVCHGRPEDAPDFIRARFPVETDQAYNYSIGEIIGAVSISLPLTRLQNQLQLSLQGDFLYLGGVFLGLILCLGLLIRANVTRPLTALSAAMNRVIRTGHFDERLPGRGDDEIGRVIEGFNQVVERVGDGIRQLEASEHRFRALTDNVRDGMVSFLPDGKVILFNHRAEAIFGYSRSEVLGMDIARLIAPMQETGAETLVRFLEETLESRDGGLLTLKGLRRDLEPLALEVSLSRASSDGHTFFTVMVRPKEGPTN